MGKGCSDSKTLNRTVFYTLSQNFGTRDIKSIMTSELKTSRL